MGLAVAAAVWPRSFRDVAWPDECIYLVGARNLVERGSLSTNYYLTGSLLARGYPHRDVHMPGYVLSLTPFVAALGTTLSAAAALNVALFLGCILLVHAIASELLSSAAQALLAGVLFAIAPPCPGYLFVAYPELLAVFAFLGACWLTLRATGSGSAFVAGVAFGLGALVRETLLIAAPIALWRLPRRDLLRGFLPGAAAALLLVVAPLSRDRAIHPNALYPSVLEEARRSPDPLSTLSAALLRNASQNLQDASEARPFTNAEDAVLLLLLALAGAAVAARTTLVPATRRVFWATLLSLVLLSIAVLFLYVVRARGGVWGGVRAYMAWGALLVVFAVPLLWRIRNDRARTLVTLAIAGALLFVDARQLYAIFRYKASDHEDQTRYAAYVASYVAREAPRRIVGRLFIYGLEHYPTEIVWSAPRDFRELQALERALPFDYIVINGQSPLRLHLIRNARYFRVNAGDRDAELLIFRRLG